MKNNINNNSKVLINQLEQIIIIKRKIAKKTRSATHFYKFPIISYNYQGARVVRALSTVTRIMLIRVVRALPRDTRWSGASGLLIFQDALLVRFQQMIFPTAPRCIQTCAKSLQVFSKIIQI